MLNEKKHPGLVSFLPIIVYVAVYLGAGIIFQLQGVELAFYQFPTFGAVFISIIVTLLIGTEKLDEKIRVFIDGIADNNVITMLLVYIFAGGFSGIATAMGGRDATVNLGLSVIPVQFLAAGVFVIAAFMGTATGTSVGSISAIAPIAIGIAVKAGLSVPLVLGACIGGAMFGDNLSMISDTTIAATTSQGVALKDKFMVNVRISIPAAIITIVLLLIFGHNSNGGDLGDLSFQWIKVVPYLVVFILAIVGINVFITLIGGILVAGAIGIACGDFTFTSALSSVYSGVVGMDEMFYLALLLTGVSALSKSRGGIEWLNQKLKKISKSNKNAQLSIALLVFLMDIMVANNTVAIILSGDLAKNVSKEFKIDPRKTASILDIFSCVPQGLLPYSGQILVGAGFAAAAGVAMTTLTVVPYIWYCYILGICALVDIFVPYADGYLKKHPWNWEEEKLEAKAE